MTKTGISRRGAMLMGSALPVMIALPAAAQSQTAAKDAPAGKANTVKLGGFEVTTLLGGASMREKPIETFGLGVDPAEFAKLSEDNFIPSDRSGQSFTMTLVKTPEALVLFDTGMFPENNKAALAAAGYTPEDVTHIVLTHMHGDHVSGMMQGETPMFPNAKLIAPKDENDYWAANPSEAYTAHVAPLIDKATLIGDGDTVLPGITAAAAYGHTPGHTIYLLESDGQKLLITGDSFNHYVYSVQRPDWHVRFDVDKDMGATTRKAVLARLAEERIPFVGYHMPFPALAFIAKGEADDTFRYVPATYQLAG
ncbi:MBL fold metallo-hydrolase [Paracoccus aestuariivivens]|uniref:MBL fold metallo-hydrolase n=1 Tax=Paracoccus aestuariivivens TaxID=1820333 RepID=A0A6L6JAN8_9RHOB|nr:MBL fold metallo-hydrolase [Paracoccus aestuariivivens]MTH78255.1 MBL fold metallo-hydrolase [Paracoccus aestuariivivens]